MKYIISERQYKSLILEQLRVAPTTPNFPQVKYPPIPLDLKGQEQNYRNDPRFFIPSARFDNYTKSRFSNTLIPPQSAMYYWDTDENYWVQKSEKNVSKWRDVPAGYHPSEYGAALEWEKQNPGTFKKFQNPYRNSKFPLGLTQAQKEQSDQEYAAGSRQTPKRNLAQLSQDAQKIKSDTTGNWGQKQDIEKQRQLEQTNYIADLDRKWGKFIPKDESGGGFDWFGFALMVAGFIPVVGPITRVINLGYNLTKAGKKFVEGDGVSAGIDLLFAFSPTFNKIGAKNLSNLIKMKQVPTATQNFIAKSFNNIQNEFKNNISKVVKNIPIAKDKLTPQEISNLLKNGFESILDETSVRSVTKKVGKQIDRELNR